MTTAENRVSRAVMELKARTAELADAQRIAKLGLWQWDIRTNDFKWSEGIYRILGLDPVTFEVSLESTFSCIHPDDREETMSVLLSTVSDRKAKTHTYRALAADGQLLHFWSSTQVVFDESGEPIRVSGICQDITESILAQLALRESEDHYRHAVQLNPHIPWTADNKGNVLEIGPRWVEMTGMPEAKALGSGWSQALHPDEAEATFSQWKRALETGKALHVEYRIRLSDGTYNWMKARAAARIEENGIITRWYGTLEDIQAEKSAQLTLIQSQVSLSAVLGSTTDSVILVDGHGRVTYLNPRAQEVLKDVAELSTGVVLWDAFPEELDSQLHNGLLQASAEKSPLEVEVFLKRLGMWLEVHAFPTNDGLSIFFRNITDARQAREEITFLAHYDALTQLPNRAYFLQRMEKIVQQAVDTTGKLALIYLDLDDFKTVNDTYGHDAGDTVLREAAKRLERELPASTLIGRIGGDEFAVLIQENADESTLLHMLTEIQEALAASVSHNGAELSCKASMGIAFYPLSDHRPTELQKNADLALYKAKRSGGNQYAFFSEELRASMQQRLTALSCARDALARKAIIPFYQPKVSLETGLVCGFEALLRWTGPNYGINPPGLIKDAFEDPVLSVELGKRMLELVVADMVSWRKAGLAFGHVALNVATQELLRTPYADNVLAALQQAQLPAGLLEIEITETVFLGDGTDGVATTLRKLHDHGVSIALDDFGTGYASLSHLNNFPVSWVKIDQSFIREMNGSADAMAIVKAVISLSRNLGIQVVAEGVETIQQWRHLKKRGCDLAQGFLIAKPMSAGRVAHFLQTWEGIDDRAFVKARSAS